MTNQSVQAIISDPGVPAWNKLRIVILYALRYQKTQTNNIAALVNMLLTNGVSQEDVRVCVFTRICSEKTMTAGIASLRGS